MGSKKAPKKKNPVFSKLGKKGGAAILKERGPEYFSKLAKRGWKKRRAAEKAAAGK